MPRMNGLEVARSMRAWRQPPYILFLPLDNNQAHRTAAH